MMTVSELAYHIIALVEGEKLTAYQDATGHWTIGFGHTGPEVKKELTITSKQALELWQEDSAPLLEMVKYLQIYAAAALVSFGYNTGESALRHVLKVEPENWPATMRAYIHSGGRVLDYLVRRRAFEAAMVEAAT